MRVKIVLQKIILVLQIVLQNKLLILFDVDYEKKENYIFIELQKT